MAENKRDFVKINEEDLQYAEQFFDNEKHFNEWLVNVFNYYRGKEVKIKTKIVQKYFDNYKKTMNIVMVLSQKGKETYKKRVENKQVTEDTLEAYLEPTCEDTLNLPEINLPVNSKYINSKEVNNNNKVINNNKVEFEILDEFSFDLFWELYDKKTGKETCFKLYSKLNQKEKEKIFNHVPLYKQSKPDKQFRKDPQTYLRNKSWNDEIILPEEKSKLSNFITLYKDIQNERTDRFDTGKKFGEI